MKITIDLKISNDRFKKYSGTLKNALLKITSDKRKLVSTADIINEWLQVKDLLEGNFDKDYGQVSLDINCNDHQLFSRYPLITRDTVAYHPDGKAKIITDRSGICLVKKAKNYNNSGMPLITEKQYDSLGGLEIKFDPMDFEPLCNDFDEWEEMWSHLARDHALFERYKNSRDEKHDNNIHEAMLPIYFATNQDSPIISPCRFDPESGILTSAGSRLDQPTRSYTIIGVEKSYNPKKLYASIRSALHKTNAYFK